VSFEVFLLAGFKKLIINAEILNELFIYVSYTALCFLAFSFRGSNIIKNLNIDLKLSIPYSFFKILSILFFIVSFYGLFFVSGFDVASSRQEDVNATMEFYNSSARYSIIQLIFNVLNMLLVPFTLYGGWMVGSDYFTGDRRIRFIYLLPLLTGLMNVIAGGGRAGNCFCGDYFVLGLLLALFSFHEFPTSRARGLLKYGIVFLALFFLYVNFVSTSRTKLVSGRNTYYVSLEQYPSLKPFYGIMEYSVFHYQGYQWRRMDSTSPELEFGRKTFSFILDFNVPVISQIMSKDISLKSIFKLKDIDTVRGTSEALKRKLPGPSITATVYYVLYDDFGRYGVYIITFLFVGITEAIYRRLFLKYKRSFWSVILFIAVYHLWTSTTFSHHLTGAWFNQYLYPIIIIEFANYLYNHRYKQLIRYELA